MTTRAVFIDKDGTLLRNVPYNVDPHLVEPMPGVLSALCRLQSAGYRLIVITHQPGIAHGYFLESAYRTLADYLKNFFLRASVELTTYYCPHHPQAKMRPYQQNCLCRPPQPGLLLQAARDQGIALSESWMIGNSLDDIEAGRRVGCRTILVDNGSETEWHLTHARRPHFIVQDLEKAAETIMADQRLPGSPMPVTERRLSVSIGA